ncbi:MAG TPA: hypothetical protein VN285_09185 [Candidatus Deferrimicrobium sp.]|nr:hypothetical protein [Candidatus Deferrimicrobium sp.]
MRFKAFAIGSLLVILTVLPSPAFSSPQLSEKLSLTLEAVPVKVVLQTLAREHNLNLVVSGDVVGEVTLRLDGIDVATALRAILTPLGCNYFLLNDVIVVKPTGTDAPEELVSRVITLKYVDPATARKALESRRSPKGQIIVLDPTVDEKVSARYYRPNRLLLTDVAAVVDEMAGLIEELDQPERMVSIQVKIIENTVDKASKLGLSWPTLIQAALGQSDSGSTASSTGSLRSAGEYNPNSGDWVWGTLSVAQVSAVLDFLSQSGTSKIVSDPHITTLENHEAEIRVQTIIPIATINRFTEGAALQDIVTFQDKEVGLLLKVTPRITGDGTITLEVQPKVEDIIGYTGPPDNQKPKTASRSIKTNITVANGETAALGGLLKEGEIIREHRVPLLGSIPLLGKLLFTNRSKEKSTTDLIILITPRVLP